VFAYADCRCLGDLVPHGKGVREVAIMAFSPEMAAGFGLDGLGADTDALSTLGKLPLSTRRAPDLHGFDSLTTGPRHGRPRLSPAQDDRSRRSW
jgi:hypothetical protein